MSELHALLIGIADYCPGPDGKWYPNLNGPARDVARMALLLRDQAGLKPENTCLLLSREAEPPERRPTYANLVAAFQQLADAAAPGDRVYVHYSGHGERVPTDLPEIKGFSGWDEALVPCDIGWPGSRYFRDRELSFLMGLLRGRGLLVTVVLDCCHAGGLELPAADSVLFASCRPDECAHEHPFDEGGPCGVFSYWLYEILLRHGLELSCGELHQRLLAHVRGSFPDQAPVLFGDRERRFLSGERPSATRAGSPPGPMVLRVDEAGRVLIDLGVPAGAQVGDRVILQGSLSEDALAELAIRQVGSTESWAEVTRILGPGSIEPGVRAEVLRLRRLEHLEKFQHILTVENPEPAPWLGIGIELCHGDSTDLRCGATRSLRIVNRSTLRLDFTAFDLAPDYSVTQLLPERGIRSLLALDPDQEKELSFRGWLPPGCDEGIHVLKVFATHGVANLHWLELPPLDRPGPVLRSGLIPSEFPEEEWITAQVEIHVRR